MHDNWIYIRDHFWFNLKVGGSVAHTSGVINALNKRVSLKVISNDELPNLDISNYTLLKPIFRFPKEIAELLFSIKIFLVLSKKRPSHIYTRYSGFSLGSILFKLFHPKTILVLEYNSSDYWKLKNWAPKFDSKWKDLLFKLYIRILKYPLFILERIQLNYSDRIIVVSKALKSQLIENGVDKKKIKFYHNGVEKQLFKRVKRYNQEINSKSPYFIFVGSFGQWHGIEFILKSFKIFIKNNEKGNLIMIGNGPLFLFAQHFIREHKLEDRIFLLGEQTKVKTLEWIYGSIGCINASMNNSDGTDFFGSPTKLFEYFLSERITLCSSVGGFEKEFKDMALFFDSNKPESLAILKELVITNQINHSSIAQYAKSQTLKRHSWEKHIEEVLDGII